MKCLIAKESQGNARDRYAVAVTEEGGDGDWTPTEEDFPRLL